MTTTERARPAHAARRARRTPTWSTRSVALAVVPTVLAWPFARATVLAPGPAPDRSYTYVLERAAATGQGFGPHLAFTYGPLGFLTQTHLFYGWPFALSLLAMTGLIVAANAVVIAGVCRTWPWPSPGWLGPVAGMAAAYLLTLALTSPLGRPYYLADAVALALGVWLLESARTARGWLVCGCLVSIFGLVLPTLGAALVAVAVIAVAARPVLWRDAVRLGVPAAVTTFVVLWLATGGSLTEVPRWLDLSAQLSGGYASAMGASTPGTGWTWVCAAVELCLLVVAVVVACRGRPGRHAAGLAVMAAVVAWLLLKEGFVRQDGHVLIFLVALPFVIGALRPRAHGWITTAAIVGSAVVGLSATLALHQPLANPVSAVHSIGSVIRTTVDPTERNDAEVAARTRLRAEYQVPAGLLRAIGSRPVAIEPYEAAVTWAYPGLHLATLPTIQEYTAYTTGLDELNAGFYRSPSAPPFVLAQAGTIDGREQAWEPPAAALALRCHYAVQAVTTDWVLLRHSTPRCGHPVDLATVQTGFGHQVTVPAAPPGCAITASLSLQTPWWWRVSDVALKPTALHVDVGDVAIRVPPGTAADPHLLSFPEQAGFWTVPTIQRFSVDLGGEGTTAPGVTVRFQAYPVTPG